MAVAIARSASPASMGEVRRQPSSARSFGGPAPTGAGSSLHAHAPRGATGSHSSSASSLHGGAPAPPADGQLNPYAVAFGQQQRPSQEVHIVKVSGDTVQLASGPQPDSLLHKLGGLLPHSASDLPLSPTPAAGPPPPSPPASVDRLPLSESPASATLALPPHPAPLPSPRPVTFEDPPARSSLDSRGSGLTHPSRFANASAPPAGPSSLPNVPSMHRSMTVDVPAAPADADASPLRQQSTHSNASGYLLPPTPVHATGGSGAPRTAAPAGPARRNTTGGFFGARNQATTGGSLDADADDELQSDILQQADQIRRERQSKRARAQAQQEADRGLTRSQSKRSVDENKVMMGNLIGEGHVNYVLMYNMLTGIRIAVSRCQAKIKGPLVDDDFNAKHKYSFDIVGNELTPSAKYDFKFKDYAPFVFRELREDAFRLDPSDYLVSLTAKYILTELGSPGKSGSFFYFSRDYRFIIKTIHHNEHKFLRSIIKRYYEHVKSNPHTLLSRFYGLHRVKLPRGRKIHFVIMNNLFPPHKDVHETYDLKGSTVGRMYPEDKAATNPRAVLKDLNWIYRKKELELGPEKQAYLTEQLRRDSDFLKEIGVMDYSLLIGIHNVKRGNRDNVRRNTLKVFSPDMMHIRHKNTQHRGPKSPEAAAIKRAMRDSDPRRLADAVDHLPDDVVDHRDNFVFYQDDGGYRATDDMNMALDTIYYLGVIDILTPYNMKKRFERLWKGLKDDIHKISPVPSEEYGDRFFSFMKAVMRGGGGGEPFLSAKDPHVSAADGPMAPNGDAARPVPPHAPVQLHDGPIAHPPEGYFRPPGEHA